MKKIVKIFLVLVLICSLFPGVANANIITKVGMPDLTSAIQGEVPEIVTGLSVSNTTVKQVDLTWSAVSGAKKYKIYRSLSVEGSFKYVGTSNTTVYYNKGLKASTTYYYCVSAVNTKGEGLKSSIVTATTKGNLPTTVSGLKVSSSGVDVANLTWRAVSGADSYNIYRSISTAGNFTSVGTSATTSYQDEGLKVNTKYYYRVSAVNVNGEGKQSSAVSLTTRAKVSNYTALGDSIASGLSATEGKGYVDLCYNYLTKQKSNTEMKLDNIAVSGYTSSDLLAQLQDSEVRNTIAQSKDITICIGSNNLLKPTIAAIAAAFGLDSQDPNFITDLNTKLSDPASLAILAELMKPEKLPKSLTAGVTQFGTDWLSIVSTIRTLSPNAKIYVMTLYNPLSKDNIAFGVIDSYVQAINKIIQNSHNQYKVVDVYSSFLNNQGDPVIGMSLLNPHPTDKGHNLIYQAHVKSGLK